MILHAPTSTKSTKTQPSKSAKRKYANKNKNALKKHQSGKNDLFAYFRFCACKEKKIEKSLQ